MNNLSHTQEYYLCAANPKGGVPTETVMACLIISGTAEMLRTEFLTRDEKSGCPPTTQSHGTAHCSI